MEIEVSRGALVSVLTSVLLLLLLSIGLMVSPRDGAGTPLVLSPSYLATQRYLDASGEWLKDLSRVDEDLAALLEEQGNIPLGGLRGGRVCQPGPVCSGQGSGQSLFQGNAREP